VGVKGHGPGILRSQSVGQRTRAMHMTKRALVHERATVEAKKPLISSGSRRRHGFALGVSARRHPAPVLFLVGRLFIEGMPWLFRCQLQLKKGVDAT